MAAVAMRTAGGTGPLCGRAKPGTRPEPLHAGGPAVRRLLQLDDVLKVTQQVGVVDGVEGLRLLQRPVEC